VARSIKATASVSNIYRKSGTNTSKSLTDHSAVTSARLIYISIPTLIEDHTHLAG